LVRLQIWEYVGRVNLNLDPMRLRLVARVAAIVNAVGERYERVEHDSID